MNVNLVRTYMIAALVLLLSACGGNDSGGVDSSAAKQPDTALMAGIQHLRDNDLKSFVNHALPADALAKMRSEYEASRQEPISAEERAQFEEQIQKLTAPNAEQALMDELRPALQQYGPQIPMMVGFGQGMLISSVQQAEQLDATQKADAVKSIEAIGGWLSSADLASEAKAEQAVRVMVATARDMKLSTMDDVRAMSFDEMLERMSTGMAGAKEVLNVYGFSVDDVLASMTAEVVETGETEATVKVNYTLLGAQQSAQTNMVRIGDNWYGSELVEGINED